MQDKSQSLQGCYSRHRIDEFVPQDLTGLVVKLDDQYCAAGGFGDIYRCKYYSNSGLKEVAVKTFRFQFKVEEEGRNGKHARMIRRELGIWGRLSHTNIVPFLGTVSGFGRLGNTSLVSLWMPNGTLQDFILKHDDTLIIASRLRLLIGVANGLQYLHSHSIVHGDLSPNNVLIDENDNARLTDFGYASLVGEIPEALKFLQMSSLRAGTLRWAAPERLPLDPEGKPEHTVKSDIFSFGSIALQVLSGKQPWSEVNHDAAVQRLLSQGHKPYRPQSRPIEDLHWEFIERCWSAVQDRPPAEHLVSTIDSFLRSRLHAASPILLSSEETYMAVDESMVSSPSFNTSLPLSATTQELLTSTSLYGGLRAAEISIPSAHGVILTLPHTYTNVASYGAQTSDKPLCGRPADSMLRSVALWPRPQVIVSNSGTSRYLLDEVADVVGQWEILDLHCPDSAKRSFSSNQPLYGMPTVGIPLYSEQSWGPYNHARSFALPSTEQFLLFQTGHLPYGSLYPPTPTMAGPEDPSMARNRFGWRGADTRSRHNNQALILDQNQNQNQTQQRFHCGYSPDLDQGLALSNAPSGSFRLSSITLVDSYPDAWMVHYIEETMDICAPPPDVETSALSASGFLRAFDGYDIPGGSISTEDNNPLASGFLRAFSDYEFASGHTPGDQLVQFQFSSITPLCSKPTHGSGPLRRTSFECHWAASGPLCNSRVMSDKHSVIKHLQMAHGIEPGGEKAPKPCHWEHCRKVLRTESMARHILTVHVKESPRCPDCGTQFAHEDSLRRHLRRCNALPRNMCTDSHPREPY